MDPLIYVPLSALAAMAATVLVSWVVGKLPLR